MTEDKLFLDIRYSETDKADVAWSQNTGKIFFFPFSIHAISVTKGQIILKPRASFKASLTTDHYETPIVISIEELLNYKSG